MWYNIYEESRKDFIMILLNDNQATELLKNPKKLLKNYEKLLNCIDSMVNVVNSQISFTPSNESYCFNKLIKHRDIVSRMRKEVRKEMNLFSDYIALCDDRLEADVDGTYKKQKKIFEKLLQADNVLHKKLINGENEYNRAIKDIEKMFNELEEIDNAKSKKISDKDKPCGRE